MEVVTLVSPPYTTPITYTVLVLNIVYTILNPITSLVIPENFLFSHELPNICGFFSLDDS